MAFAPPARHLLCAKDLADARYFEPLEVDDLARAAGLSCAHFSREFRRVFGESPHAYLLTRRLGCVVRAYARPQHRTFREAQARPAPSMTVARGGCRWTQCGRTMMATVGAEATLHHRW